MRCRFLAQASGTTAHWAAVTVGTMKPSMAGGPGMTMGTSIQSPGSPPGRLAAAVPRIGPVDISFGHKCFAGNLYVHELAPAANAYFFMDGDGWCSPGSIGRMAERLRAAIAKRDLRIAELSSGLEPSPAETPSAPIGYSSSAGTLADMKIVFENDDEE